jgi:hypothetical protein
MDQANRMGTQVVVISTYRYTVMCVTSILWMWVRYVGSGGTVTSNLVKCKPGDKITGIMTETEADQWTVIGEVGGQNVTLHYNRKALTFTTASPTARLSWMFVDNI